MSATTFWARWALVTAVGVGVVVLAGEADAASDKKKSSVTRARKDVKRTAAVPEIPAGGAAAALTLILGGTAIALDRRRRKAK